MFPNQPPSKLLFTSHQSTFAQQAFLSLTVSKPQTCTATSLSVSWLLSSLEPTPTVTSQRSLPVARSTPVVFPTVLPLTLSAGPLATRTTASFHPMPSSPPISSATRALS